MTEANLKTNTQSLFKNPKRPSRKSVLKMFVKYAYILVFLILSGIIGAAVGYWWGSGIGQTLIWDQISTTENQLRDLYSNSTQTQLKAWLPDVQMNFTDGLIWESQRLNYTEDRP